MKFTGMITSAAAMAVAALSAGSAQAAQYIVSYTSGGTNNFSGVFTTTDIADPNGYYTVTAITGQRNGFAASLVPVGAYFGNDNLFKPTSGYFSSGGVSIFARSFSIIFNGGDDQNVGLAEHDSTGRTRTVTSFTVSNVSAVPEPATWLTMILGMGMIGFAMRGRQKISTSVKFA